MKSLRSKEFKMLTYKWKTVNAVAKWWITNFLKSPKQRRPDSCSRLLEITTSSGVIRLTPTSIFLFFISSHTPVLLAYSNSAFRPQGQKVCGCNYKITKTK